MNKFILPTLVTTIPWLIFLLLGIGQEKGYVDDGMNRLVLGAILILMGVYLIFGKRLFNFDVTPRQLQIWLLVLVLFFGTLAVLIKIASPEVRLIGINF